MKSCNTQKRACFRSGFTIVEVSVVVALVGVMLVVTMASLADSRADRALDAVAREISAVAREVQNYALTGRQVSDVNVACLYGMKAVNATQYQVFYQYREADRTCADALSDDTEYFSHTLPHGVKFFEPNSDFSVRYVLPHANLVESPMSEDPFRIVLTKPSGLGDRYIVICLYENGSVITTKPSPTAHPDCS
jgi:prepilin-type N-terminal cleavage/methylation domain-containing protein